MSVFSREPKQCSKAVILGGVRRRAQTHFPATIAELYDPEKMPDNLRAEHERNDEVLERIYIGRRYRNDTERLEKLFDLYTKVTGSEDMPLKKRCQATKPRGR